MEYARLGSSGTHTAPLLRRALEERCVLRADLVLTSTLTTARRPHRAP
jgi:hypothetical protein